MIKGRPHQRLWLKKTTSWKNKTCLLFLQTGYAAVQQGDQPKPRLETVCLFGFFFLLLGGWNGRIKQHRLIQSSETRQSINKETYSKLKIIMLQFGSLLLTTPGYKCLWCQTCEKMFSHHLFDWSSSHSVGASYEACWWLTLNEKDG